MDEAGPDGEGAAGRTLDDFHWLGEMNKAAAIMLVERGIVPRPLGAAIARAVGRVLEEGAAPGAARPGDYLTVERALVALAGPEVTRLHAGRSRQDITATNRRLHLREALLEAAAALAAVRAALLARAAAQAEAIVPTYTWGVQAQPISFGHYLGAYAAAFARAGARLREAWARLNRSPLGAAALATSSFPIDRPRLAALLGFDGVIENSLDASQIAPVDCAAEAVGIASSCALTAGMLLADLAAQYGQARPWLQLAAGDLTGTSSIMPQKRNPTFLVTLRTLASAVVGEAGTCLLQAHNVPAGAHDYKGDRPERVLRECTRLLAGLGRLTEALILDAPRALAEVETEYATTTELADVLQREAEVPFRVGHHFASALVDYGRSRDLPPLAIPYAEAQRLYRTAAAAAGTAQRELPLAEAAFRRALTPAAVVAAKRGLGGPQAAEVARMLAAEQAGLAADRAWLAGVRTRLAAAERQREADFAALCGATV